jgi:hypothetical protein
MKKSARVLVCFLLILAGALLIANGFGALSGFPSLSTGGHSYTVRVFDAAAPPTFQYETYGRMGGATVTLYSSGKDWPLTAISNGSGDASFANVLFVPAYAEASKSGYKSSRGSFSAGSFVTYIILYPGVPESNPGGIAVTTSKIGEGTITPSGTIRVAFGQSVTFFASPATGWQFDHWSYHCGFVQDTITTSTFTRQITDEGGATAQATFTNTNPNPNPNPGPAPPTQTDYTYVGAGAFLVVVGLAGLPWKHKSQ